MKSEIAKIDGDTPALRLLSLLEVIAEKDQFFTLQGLVEETGLPKPTLHRMLQQLETAGMLQRDGDSRQYGTGVRLRRLAENLLLNNTVQGARHAVLGQLVKQVGESCNLTALSGNEVLYLDRVETEAPLRFYLHPGSQVPVHCSASGKLFLAQMTPTQRKRLLAHVPLERFTPNTLTDLAALESEIERVRREGYAFDDEEFLPGLICLAVLVPAAKGRSNLGIALQAPTMRLTPEKALQFLPALRQAAESIAAIDAEATPGNTASG
ncbi:transcriptional regulator, IclR family [Modicisalibacter ilicicola DSM 19980]|uniref:Transcriptional regulator, IclR family n=1 Tax=Modicisalibacter ilicicola DSM 19980 TaxID=1121942 RepID=A0A1M4TJC9_9GAMM|nr:IclR family transcriptional regulator [Halomonas ilicicola]SHE44599.1 transcriptional regulator, IclR family [Halomonas ilicicola DSM 19980]